MKKNIGMEILKDLSERAKENGWKVVDAEIGEKTSKNMKDYLRKCVLEMKRSRSEIFRRKGELLLW